MIFEWFNTKDVDALADRLSQELAKRVPPDSAGVQGKKADANLAKTRETLLRQAREFTGQHHLNVFKKARLANRLKWTLREAGYPKEFVDNLTFELARAVALAQRVA